MMRSVFQRFFLPITALLCGLWLTACQQTGEALLDRKQRENEAEIQQYISANNLQATQIATYGVYYVKTVSAPNSQSANVGDEIRFHVVARRLDGTVLDSTDGIHPIQYAYGTTPNRGAPVLTYGSLLYSNLTNGMFLGLTVAREGEKLTVLVPSALDAGRYGTLELPQYSPIRYDMRIVSIRTETEQINDYLAANKIVVTKLLPDSLRIATTRAQPDSALIKVGETATIQYTGRFMDGTVFETNVPTAAAIATTPSSVTTGFDVKIGETRVIPGWTEGLQQVRRGEKFFLIIPSASGYGPAGSPPKIPKYAPLSFEMEIIRVR